MKMEMAVNQIAKANKLYLNTVNPYSSILIPAATKSKINKGSTFYFDIELKTSNVTETEEAYDSTKKNIPAPLPLKTI